MKRDLLIGIDVGSSGLRLLTVDRAGRLLAESRSTHAILSPCAGWAELSAEQLFSDMLAAFQSTAEKLSAAGRSPGEVAAIGCASLCTSLTAVDGSGETLFDPILYTDRRSAELQRELAARVDGKEFFRRTGNRLSAAAASVVPLCWVRRERSDVYARIGKIGHAGSLVGHWLSGRFLLDYSHASKTGLFRTFGRPGWDASLCAAFDINEAILPETVPARQTIGNLTQPELLAMGFSSDTVIAAGGADSACALLSAGIFRAGQLCNSTGSTDVFSLCAVDPSPQTGLSCRHHVVDGMHLCSGAMSYSGSAYRWAGETVCRDLKEAAGARGESLYSLMDAEAAASPPGANGVLFLPYLGGERCPVWDAEAKGAFWGLTTKTTRGDMLRAVMESCSCGARQILHLLEQTGGRPVSRFTALGGNMKSPLWAQIKADVTNAVIDVPAGISGAALGAAMLAGVASGVYTGFEDAVKSCVSPEYRRYIPREENRAVYDARFAQYELLYPALRALY